MARMRKYVAYCKTPASLLGFSGSKFMSLSLGPGKILVTQESKTSIQKPDLMDGVKLNRKKKKIASCLELGQNFTPSGFALC